MSKTTTNYGLIKPELTDAADITAMNANWDKIDEEIKKASESGSGVTIYTATIGTSWTENEETGVKSQKVVINGVTAEHTAKVDHAYTGNGSSESYATFVDEENQYLEFITNGYAETYNGGITFYIFGDANTVNIPIVVEVA